MSARFFFFNACKRCDVNEGGLRITGGCPTRLVPVHHGRDAETPSSRVARASPKSHHRRVSPETPAVRFRRGGRRKRGIALGTFRDGLGASHDRHSRASLGGQQHVRPREVDPHPRPQNAQHQARAAGHAVRSHRRPRASEWTFIADVSEACDFGKAFSGRRRHPRRAIR